MTKEEKPTKSEKLRKNLIEWAAIGAVLGIVYLTGMHTHIMVAMQRAMLWTGFFDAKTEITLSDGPFLGESDFDFTVVTNEGRQMRLEDYKGKVMFVNVWASWCPPCVAEMPTIETLYSSVSDRDDIGFLILSLDENRQDAVGFMEGKNFDLPYHFPASTVPDAFRSPYLPTTYVVTRDGQVVYEKVGIADYSSPSFRDWLIGLTEL